MANDRKISQLDSAVLLTGDELIPIVQPVDDPKDNRRITLDQVRDFVLDDFSGGHVIQNATAVIPQQDNLNFTGAIQAVDNAGNSSSDISIVTNGISAALFRQSVGLSVVGNATNTLANVADITAGADHNILRRSGITIGFGTINLAEAGAVGTSILPIANGGTGSATVPYYLLVSGGTLSGANTFVATGANNVTYNYATLGANTGFLLNSNSTDAASDTQTLFKVTQTGANVTTTQTTFAGYFSNTKTGTLSTNIASYFEASGGASNNYAIKTGSGSVLIGSASSDTLGATTTRVDVRGINDTTGLIIRAANLSNTLRFSVNGNGQTSITGLSGTTPLVVTATSASAIVITGSVNATAIVVQSGFRILDAEIAQAGTAANGTYHTRYNAVNGVTIFSQTYNLNPTQDGAINTRVSTYYGIRTSVVSGSIQGGRASWNLFVNNSDSDIKTGFEWITVNGSTTSQAIRMKLYGNMLAVGADFTPVATLEARGSGTTTNKGFRFSDSANTERFVILDNGKTGIGITPTATLHLKAGSTAAESAPIKLTSGSLMTAPEAGSIEFLTDLIYFTNTSGPNRYQLPLWNISPSSGRVIYNTTGGRLTDNSLFTFVQGTARMGVGVNSPLRTIHARQSDEVLDSVVPTLYLEKDIDTGTPVVGIGTGIEFDVVSLIGGAFNIVATDLTTSSEDFKFQWSLMTAGAAYASKMELDSLGNLSVVNAYIGAVGTTPSHTLHIKGATNNANLLLVEEDGGTNILEIIEAGGVNKIGVFGAAPVAQQAGLTAITHTAPGTPDYALQDLVQGADITAGFGFATKDEGNTLLSVVKAMHDAMKLYGWLT